ncbi:MAG TPA: UDP-N-acetylmuramoyl-L-alanyl-D-glutamate--2,6-diaminopimelate ligase [Gammaproteobacteria bacterium]|nr:UDP-N-acetylmuramoyl-L-alanyl-D-glutamate--2,6-diaminopimelate ligase [Gammaproteobacteria bacterium]
MAPLAAAKTLGELLGAEALEHAGLAVSDLVLDSRDVHPGAAFVAVQGGCTHGLAHAGEAIARGAVAILYEPPAESAPSSEIPSVAVAGLKRRLGELARKLYGAAIDGTVLAGITGTNGKTTVAYLAAQAASRGGAACGYIGTLGYGVPPTLTPHALTTPDCFTLHRELAALATGRSALEVSSHALSQQRIAGLEIATAAFTNLSRDHLDAHGDLEAYGRAKALLFTRPGVRRAVLNVGNPFALRLLALLPPGVEPIRVRARPAGAGISAATETDLEAEVEDRGLEGLVLAISGRFGTARLASPLVGDFNAENLLVALGVLLAWDMPLADACAALAAAAPPPGRLEVIGGGAGRPTVIVDYAHTPDGLERVLRALKRVAAGELWCVFGCGGERDRGKRPLMGAAAAAWADRVVLTDDNPRGEDPDAIVEQIRGGFEAAASPSRQRLRVEHDRRRAIAHAVGAAGPRDVVLVAGKGHETQQLVGAASRPFSDREAAAAALGGRAC